MVIREADGELDLSGSPSELNAIADALQRLQPGADLSMSADAGADPKPYHHCLTALNARVTDGPVRITLSGDYLEITGSLPMLRTFASFFRVDANAPSGTHQHHEWFEGNDYVAPDSLPTVIRVA